MTFEIILVFGTLGGFIIGHLMGDLVMWIREPDSRVWLFQ